MTTNQINFTPEELQLIWVVLNNDNSSGRVNARLYFDLGKEDQAMKIMEKINVYKTGSEETGLTEYKEGKLELTTEEKMMLLEFLRKYGFPLQFSDIRKNLIKKLS